MHVSVLSVCPAGHVQLLSQPLSLEELVPPTTGPDFQVSLVVCFADLFCLEKLEQLGMHLVHLELAVLFQRGPRGEHRCASSISVKHEEQQVADVKLMDGLLRSRKRGIYSPHNPRNLRRAGGGGKAGRRLEQSGGAAALWTGGNVVVTTIFHVIYAGAWGDASQGWVSQDTVNKQMAVLNGVYGQFGIM
jgi:hypothetical protein